MIFNEAEEIIIGNGSAEVTEIYIGDEVVWSARGIREKTGIMPISFKSNGNDIISCKLFGNTNGVGIKGGENYLKQVERSMPDGTYGKRVYQTNTWISFRNGTFNSGQATAIGFNFRKSDNSAIFPVNVGEIYIAEGITDHVIDGDKLDIFQGGVTAKGDYDLQYWVLRYGDDGSGDNVIYENNDTNYIPIRCGTAIYRLKPDTDYSFVRVGGDSDIEIQYTTAKDSANLNISWATVPYLNSIPGNLSPDKNKEQWTIVSNYNRYEATSTAFIVLDSRPVTYDYCAYYADLKVGHYKVIAEYYGDNQWQSTRILDDLTPYMALVSENNIQIIPKIRIFQGVTRFQHEEYEFTLSTDMKVGLYFKAIPTNNSLGFVRFMIVDYDLQAEEFNVSYDEHGDYLLGTTCWEPFYYIVPLKILDKDKSQSENIEVNIGPDKLFIGDSFDVNETIPTFIGQNFLDMDLQEKTKVHIKYEA